MVLLRMLVKREVACLLAWTAPSLSLYTCMGRRGENEAVNTGKLFQPGFANAGINLFAFSITAVLFISFRTAALERMCDGQLCEIATNEGERLSR